jgi:hypothetical protein
MWMDTRSSTTIRWVVTLLAGAVMSAGIWLAGAGEVAFLGFALAAVWSETRDAPTCRPRLLPRSTR